MVKKKTLTVVARLILCCTIYTDTIDTRRQSRKTW